MDKSFTDISLRFELRCTTASCQDVTSLITKSLVQQGLCLLNYTDDFIGDIMALVWHWSCKRLATIHELSTGLIQLDSSFQKDIQ